MVTKSLDLGSGPLPRNPYGADEVFGIDLRANLGSSIVQADLAVEPIPFEAAYFDAVTAFDFIEHVPRVLYNPDRRFPFVELMNEIFRVLKPGGWFFSRTPVYPNSELFRDPTHVNLIASDTFSYYFSGDCHAKIYGFYGNFDLVQNDLEGLYLVTQLRKVS
jgi:SAM-dependent methyltransferase